MTFDLTTLRDAVEMTGFLWQASVSPSAEDLVPKKLDAAGAAEVLETTAAALADLGPWTLEAVEEAIRGMAEQLELKPREAFQPVRVAVTGSRVSPPLFETVHVRRLVYDRMQRFFFF